MWRLVVHCSTMCAQWTRSLTSHHRHWLHVTFMVFKEVEVNVLSIVYLFGGTNTNVLFGGRMTPLYSHYIIFNLVPTFL